MFELDPKTKAILDEFHRKEREAKLARGLPEYHSWFTHIRPDEVAECWEGVDEELYQVLWGVMKHVPKTPNIEDSGPGDHVEHGSVASVWDKLERVHRERLNELARAEDDRLTVLYGEH